MIMIRTRTLNLTMVWTYTPSLTTPRVYLCLPVRTATLYHMIDLARISYPLDHSNLIGLITIPLDRVERNKDVLETWKIHKQ